MTHADQALWDEAYAEEYYGLHEDTKTWEYISEQEYRILRPTIGHALPTFAIATLKTDEDGNPSRVKYRIVVMGNLDPHSWSKNECFAPVMSQMEFRLLVAVATQLKCPVRS